MGRRRYILAAILVTGVAAFSWLIAQCLPGSGLLDHPAPLPKGELLECPFKITITPISMKREAVIVDVVVENKSSWVVGWDKEFSIGLRFAVRPVTKDGDPAGDYLRAVKVIPDTIPHLKGETAMRRFVQLDPHQQLSKRINLTDRFGELGNTMGLISPQGHMIPGGMEYEMRYRIPKENIAVTIAAVYDLDTYAFWTWFGFDASRVNLYTGRHQGVSNTVTIRFQD